MNSPALNGADSRPADTHELPENDYLFEAGGMISIQKRRKMADGYVVCFTKHFRALILLVMWGG